MVECSVRYGLIVMAQFIRVLSEACQICGDLEKVQIILVETETEGYTICNI